MWPCKPLLQRLMESVDATGGPDACWEWKKHRNNTNYGIMGVGSRTDGSRRLMRAHRVSWELHNSAEIPDGLFVLHSCDNPPCCNPAHLSVGTNVDNTNDMMQKGRQKKFGSKLVQEDVDKLYALRREGVTYRELAERFDLSVPSVLHWLRKGGLTRPYKDR